ncbi:hypothetical protein GPA22_03785 [Aromatoleum toluvorans]|uniref:Transposase n=1 Tax=Aromatoleum toluvorans TaxID=92002 RepID=A0ABX1PTT3_9RHOO|nr:hypothetical protein [Aromatoleum toluvorans]NMG42858.1 hypothetical protein [Aromatoleum toluvorans]
MKSHVAEQVLPANPRFHLRRHDGLFLPISFFLVTERMRTDIEQERELIIEALPPAQRAKQEMLFRRYDPRKSVRVFEDILRLFGIPRRS